MVKSLLPPLTTSFRVQGRYQHIQEAPLGSSHGIGTCSLRRASHTPVCPSVMALTPSEDSLLAFQTPQEMVGPSQLPASSSSQNLKSSPWECCGVKRIIPFKHL